MGKVIALSNKFSLISKQSACDTAVVEYSSQNNAFGFDYEYLGSPIQKVRIHLYISNPQNVINEKIYRGTDGVFQNNNVKIDKNYDLQTGYFDENTHDALAIACKHQVFKINDVDYSAQSGYERDDRTDLLQTNLSTAKIKVFKQGYNKTNLSC